MTEPPAESAEEALARFERVKREGVERLSKLIDPATAEALSAKADAFAWDMVDEIKKQKPPSLIDHARRHIEAMVADLEGEDDFMPFLTYNGTTCGEPSTGYVGLAMPDNTERDPIADVMMAMLAIHRATEAVFASVAWTVSAASKDDVYKVMPSESPDRVEQVFMIHVAPEGDTFHFAKVARADGKVELGGWDVHQQEAAAGGRFGDAMHMGIELGKNLPPEMIAFIDEHMEGGGETEDLIRPFMRAMQSMRGTE